MARMNQLVTPIWDMKYHFKCQDGTHLDKSIEDTWRRVATTLSYPGIESQKWEDKFYQSLCNFQFMPAGQILTGMRTERYVTLFNYFVMGSIPANMAGIFEHLKEAALTMQQGGGLGDVIDHHLNLIGFHPQQQLLLDSDVCTDCGFSKCA